MDLPDTRQARHGVEFRADTAAAKPDYEVFDLTRRTPLLAAKARDESKGKWDAQDAAGLRYEAGSGTQTVEYFRDVKPIFERSCIACHTGKSDAPAGNLVLDDDSSVKTQNPAGLGFDITVPGTYARLAADAAGKWGHKPLHQHKWSHLPNSASRYVRTMQSRRSLLIWKVFGERLDGWQNDDLPYEAIPGDPASLRHHEKTVPDTKRNRELAHIGYTGRGCRRRRR
jgi:mono/diheme cytochrome c family protein